MQTHGIIVICNRRFFSVIVIEELFSKVKVIDPKVIDNSLVYYFSIASTSMQTNLIFCKNIRFVCMLFQLLVIINNVQTIAEPLFKQHKKNSRLIILWFQKYLLNE